MKIEDLEKGQKILVECEFDSFAGANQAWVLIQGKPELAQLDDIKPDQQKPVVPKFVADWYEEHKIRLEVELLFLCWKIKEIYAEGDFEKWFENHNNPIQTLINMHQFGYTVEKEKLYTVAIPVQNGKVFCLRKTIQDGQITARICSWFSHNIAEPELKNLTETEIKERYDWAWQFAKEVME